MGLRIEREDQWGWGFYAYSLVQFFCSKCVFTRGKNLMTVFFENPFLPYIPSLYTSTSTISRLKPYEERITAPVVLPLGNCVKCIWTFIHELCVISHKISLASLAAITIAFLLFTIYSASQIYYFVNIDRCIIFVLDISRMMQLYHSPSSKHQLYSPLLQQSSEEYNLATGKPLGLVAVLYQQCIYNNIGLPDQTPVRIIY